jgi:predicted MPP superfamily phosphohydrolase
MIFGNFIFLLVEISLTFLYTVYSVYFNFINVYVNNNILKIFLTAIMLVMSQFFILTAFNKNFRRITYITIYLFSFLFSICLVKDIFNASLLMSIAVFVVLVILMLIYGYFNRNIIKTTKYNIKTNKKDINLKIIFISDLHIGSIGTVGKKIEKMVSIINKNEVDLVLFGGDIIESELIFKEKPEYEGIFKKIKSKNGVYGVLGNHEYNENNNVNDIVDKLKKKYNIEILRDNFIDIGDLKLIGRIDKSCSYRGIIRSRIDEIVKEDTDNFTLLLDHNPVDFDESIRNKIDLQLSGHTHNGQCFPFNIFIRLFFKRVYGLFKKNESSLIISSGLSPTGLPVKVGSKVEIVVITVQK